MGWTCVARSRAGRDQESGGWEHGVGRGPVKEVDDEVSLVGQGEETEVETELEEPHGRIHGRSTKAEIR